jgi:hypothetical protein
MKLFEGCGNFQTSVTQPTPPPHASSLGNIVVTFVRLSSFYHILLIFLMYNQPKVVCNTEVPFLYKK